MSLERDIGAGRPVQGRTGAGGGKLLTLEAGRFLAATAVVLYHYTSVVADFRGWLVFDDLFRPGHVGVPYFFVLSGFIIYHVHRGDIGRPRALTTFASRRAIRLYPMFLLISLLMLLGFVLVPSLAAQRPLSPVGVIADLLLLPHGDAILSISWTLRHEMLFYGLFALAIWIGRGAFLAIAAWIVASLALGLAAPPNQSDLGAWSTIAGTLNLGFGFGMVTAELLRRRTVAPAGLWVALGGAMLVLQCLAEWRLGRGVPHGTSVLGNGGDAGYMLASAILIYGLAKGEPGWRIRLPGLWKTLGGSSYILYLIHQPLGSVAMRLLKRFTYIPAEAVFCIAVAMAIAVAVVLHLTIERWLLRRLGAALRTFEGRRGSPATADPISAPLPPVRSGGPLRVAMVLSDGLSSQGGIGRITAYLTRALRERRPDIMVSIHPARLSERPVIKHLTVPLALSVFAMRCILARIDLVHINVAPRGSTWRKLLYGRVADALGRPVLLHLHGSGYDQFFAGLNAARQRRARAFFGRAAAVVVLSDYWRRFMIERIGVPADRVIEIPNGVPAAVPPPDHRPGAVPRILFLGMVGARKGTDVLLDALAELHRRGLPWSAVIGGNGAVDEARARATALGIADRIEFPGWVGESEVDTLLRAADIFVLPSRAENQPVAILEAMARAVPVVATRIGAIPEQVAEGETGLLVPPGDAAALAEALASLLAAPGRRAAMGQAGLARFDRLFAISACADRFATLYRSLGGAA